MAETKRKSEPVAPAVASEDQTKRERLTLLLYLEMAVAIVVGMIVISEFLSAGKVNETVLIVAGVLFGIGAIGILVTWLLRRRIGK
jgi:threonine/homoserine efflux transporter RhtA